MRNRIVLAVILVAAVVVAVVVVALASSGKKVQVPGLENAGCAGVPATNDSATGKHSPPAKASARTKDRDETPGPRAEKKPETGKTEETKQPQPSAARSIALVPTGWPDEARDALDTAWADVKFGDLSLQAVRDGEMLTAALPPSGMEDAPATVRASVSIFSARLTAKFTTTCKRANAGWRN
jgi:hypothetical protein